MLLIDILTQKIKHANAYFHEHYQIKEFYRISNTDYSDAYVIDSSYGISYTIISCKLASRIDFVEKGEACLSLIFSNMEWLEALKKKCHGFITNSPINDGNYFSKHWIRLCFFNFKFEMDLFDDGFKECFYAKLILRVLESGAFLRRQEDPCYQEFWQYSLREVLLNLSANNGEIERLILRLKRILITFNDETKQIYNAMVMLYDLKERR